jgi:glycerol-3-phosphate dehydrogenase (NAD(P)+)
LRRIAVVGAGAWGTALAAHLARAGHDVGIWARRAEAAAAIAGGTNADHLPGIALPELRATTDLGAAVAGAEAIVVAVPSEFARAAYRALRPVAPPGAVLVSATKGLELDTLRRMSEVAAEELPGHALAVLSGPSFAAEVAAGQPTTVVIASAGAGVAERVQTAVSTRTFRAYSSTDVVGVELGGALKNVIAIAAGIVDGLGYGHNTVAALVTRGLAEMTRLATASGARPDTLAGLAGLGDLVLTCTGRLSRNRSFGQALGRGVPVETALRERHEAVEGIRTTAAACDLAARAGTEMPIATLMRAVLYEGKAVREAVDELMLRSLKRE